MEFWNSIIFANPEAFYLLFLPLLLAAYYVWRYKKYFPTFGFSTTTGVRQHTSSIRGWLKSGLPLLRLATLTLLVVVLARPQTRFVEEETNVEGIDIVMAMDVSSSMLAKDFKPNRLSASKEVAQEFIDKRANDRIGLVSFAGESFTLCPITIDHEVVKSQIASTKQGLLEDGTAIGMGLGTAINRLKESSAISKVLILLTDGVNNRGFIEPLTAAEAAVQFGVKIYTVGVGSEGKAYAPVAILPNGDYHYDYVEVEIDEALLKQVADLTGGKYFRATDKQALRNIYNEIDELEKVDIEVSSYQRETEEFLPFALLAGALLLLELLLRYVLVRSIP